MSKTFYRGKIIVRVIWYTDYATLFLNFYISLTFLYCLFLLLIGLESQHCNQKLCDKKKPKTNLYSKVDKCKDVSILFHYCFLHLAPSCFVLV